MIGTNNYDGNTTLCMSSAVSGYKRSFGSDGPPGCYEDFEHTDCLLAFGSNLPEQHPIIYWRLQQVREQRSFPVIVVDPRVTMFAQNADMHLPIAPGTDLVLLNSLAHVIFDEGLADRDYIESLTRVGRVRSKTVTEEGDKETNEVLNALMPSAFLLLLFISVMTSGQALMTTTVEEKSSRVVELLLSAVSPMQLMAGKILGQMCVGLVLMAVYAGMGMVALVSLSALFGMLELSLLVWLVLFYLIAHFIIASLLAAIGAAVNEMREAQSLMGPVMMILMVPWTWLWTRDPARTLYVVWTILMFTVAMIPDIKNMERMRAEGFVPVEGEVPIEVLSLSTRVYNCLDQAGIATIGEILERLAKGDEEMLAIKNLGPKSLAEIKERLQAEGFIPIEEEVEAEAVSEEPVEAAEEEEAELAAPEAEEVAKEVEEEVPPEEGKAAEEPIEEEEEEEETFYEYEEEDELEERRKKAKKRRLVYDEELGEVIATRRRKPGRRREKWEDYY